MSYEDLSEHERSKREIRTLAEYPQQAQAFIDSTRDFGGASINLNSMKLAQPGESLHIVGKEKSQRTGAPVDTEYAAGQSTLTPRQFSMHLNRLKHETKDKKAMMGSWVDNKSKKSRAKGVQIDLSTGYAHKKRAEDKMLERDEDAIWNMKSMRNSRNEAVRKRRGMGPRPQK